MKGEKTGSTLESVLATSGAVTHKLTFKLHKLHLHIDTGSFKRAYLLHFADSTPNRVEHGDIWNHQFLQHPQLFLLHIPACFFSSTAIIQKSSLSRDTFHDYTAYAKETWMIQVLLQILIQLGNTPLLFSKVPLNKTCKPNSLVGILWWNLQRKTIENGLRRTWRHFQGSFFIICYWILARVISLGGLVGILTKSRAYNLH